MYVKKIFITIMILFCAVFPATTCLAAETLSLVQVYSHENNMYVFISGDIDVDRASAKIANQKSEIIDGGLLADKGITVRTTLLVDVSTSIPAEAREYVISYIETLIANIGANEEIRIVTFGEQTTVLQDFTNDRYDLMIAAEIEFDNRQSMVYDAIYNTIPELSTVNGEACYYRTIVITDGVDEANAGITKEELLIKLQNDTYPINIIHVSREKNESQDKDLASLARVSGGAYGNIFPEYDILELADTFSTDDIFWLRISIPGNLLDGSIRQVNIDDDTGSIQFDTKLPVFDMPDLDPELEDTTERENITEQKDTAEPDDTTESEDLETVNNTEETIPANIEFLKNSSSIFEEYRIVFIAEVGIAVIIIVVLIIMLTSKKKKKTTGIDIPDSNNSNDNSSNKNTEIIDSSNKGTDITEPNVLSAIGNIRIILRNISDTGEEWNLPLSEELIIGRDPSCQIHIPDTKTSRRQCKIYNQGAIYIENLSQSNITKLNGKILNKPEILKDGDKIKSGQVTLIVEKISVEKTNDWGKNSGDTEYIKW